MSAFRKYRKSRKMTQRDLALELGISQAKLSLIENEKQAVHGEEAIRFSKKTGIPLQKLIVARGS